MTTTSQLATILPKFKNKHLSHIAFLCGLRVTGKKSELVERLVAAAATTTATVKPQKSAKQSNDNKKPPLILSIDLGIRNLGFSLLTPVTTKIPTTTTLPLTAANIRAPPRVRLHAWQRRPLLLPADIAAISDPNPDPNNTDTAPAVLTPDPEPYSPASLAIAADRLTRRDVLPLKPTHVLIERQRWRSAGGSSVQEWTLRVNTLEAMLHASLRTLRELHYWDGEIISVAPERVTRFWPAPAVPVVAAVAKKEAKGKKSRKDVAVVVDEDGQEIEVEVDVDADADAAAPAGKTRINSKKHKIGVLTGWLRQGRASENEIVVPANPDTQSAVEQFRGKLSRVRRSKAAADDETAVVRDAGSRKIDDLTDSLLQGVAWLKWEENKKRLLTEEGLLQLLGTKILDEQVLDDV
ncbi:Ydc2-catalyt-domain-containing protein [Hypoxylon fragiforme]|uniref:Ydc2-catalyt-domain-containing protein n=1 Tax=Hypoxylon fragiforme TaxID=63214 RepID=UPI0020C5F559|nr:Ydc2-catalyt-domain-containing protein [Hypoxylon fragiforme]KAI2610864.1 Ydc2-catalyt-domain-containing protein [Hypoxylon fragiforme]